MQAVIRYLGDHWNGRHTLRFALWWNLVLPLLVLLIVHRYGVNVCVAKGLLPAFPSATVLIIVYVALLVWQLVGVTRISAREKAAYGGTGDVYVIYGAVFLFVLFVGINLMDLVSNVDNHDDSPHMSATGLDPLLPTFELKFMDDKSRVLSVSGHFGVASTKQLQKFLDRYPGVTTLVLDSAGGNIFEARGVGKLIKDRDLSTHVSEQCLSACTLAFVNGLWRSAGESSRFGFHSYRHDSEFPAVWLDIEKQQRIDRDSFARNGVSEQFLEKIYSAGSDTLWYPSHAELVVAGFLNKE